MAVKKLLSVFLSFLLLLSFTGTLAQAEETASMSVEKAIQVFKRQGKRRDSRRIYCWIYAKFF